MVQCRLAQQRKEMATNVAIPISPTSSPVLHEATTTEGATSTGSSRASSMEGSQESISIPVDSLMEGELISIPVDEHGNEIICEAILDDVFNREKRNKGIKFGVKLFNFAKAILGPILCCVAILLGLFPFFIWCLCGYCAYKKKWRTYLTSKGIWYTVALDNKACCSCFVKDSTKLIPIDEITNIRVYRYHSNYINIRVKTDKTCYLWTCGAKEIVLGPMNNARQFTAAVKEEQHGQRELNTVQAETERL